MSGGISVLELLGVVFVLLKLTGHIEWAWWVVTIPFWSPIAVALIIMIAMFCFNDY